jgi:hypothetical protein
MEMQTANGSDNLFSLECRYIILCYANTFQIFLTHALALGEVLVIGFESCARCYCVHISFNIHFI